MNKMENTREILKEGEPHPASVSALQYLRSIPFEKLLIYQESFSSCAIEDNRLGQICAETLRRLMNKEPVSDRYLLGLAWVIRNMEVKK